MNVLYVSLISILTALLGYYSVSFYKQVGLVGVLEKELVEANRAFSVKRGELEMCQLSLTPIINICENNNRVDKDVEYIIKEIDRVECSNEDDKERIVDRINDDVDRLLSEAYDRIHNNPNQYSR